MTSLRERAEPGPIVTSLVSLVVAIVGHAAFAVHTILSRRNYAPLLEDGSLARTATAELLLGTPGPLYGAAFVLLAMALLVKEVAFERKEVTLRINLAALALLAVLWMSWNASVAGPAQAIFRGRP
jgi:hypothetical protein